MWHIFGVNEGKNHKTHPQFWCVTQVAQIVLHFPKFREISDFDTIWRMLVSRWFQLVEISKFRKTDFLSKIGVILHVYVPRYIFYQNAWFHKFLEFFFSKFHPKQRDTSGRKMTKKVMFFSWKITTNFLSYFTGTAPKIFSQKIRKISKFFEKYKIYTKSNVCCRLVGFLWKKWKKFRHEILAFFYEKCMLCVKIFFIIFFNAINSRLLTIIKIKKLKK